MPDLAAELIAEIDRRRAEAAADPHHAIRRQHPRMEIYRLADSCDCDPNAEDYDEHHGESDEYGEYLCDRIFYGHVCGTCETEDGPEWRPDRFEWPCPTIAALPVEVSR